MASDDITEQLNDDDIKDVEAFRRTKETAILVMMFIDVVHSTALREKMGEVQFEQLLHQKKGEVTSIIERENNGKVIKDIGDGLLGVFAMPDIAVRNALLNPTKRGLLTELYWPKTVGRCPSHLVM